MIVDTASVAGPLIPLIVGLLVVLFLNLASSMVRIGSVVARVVTLLSFAFALAWAARSGVVGPLESFDLNPLFRMVADPAGQTPSLLLEARHVDLLGLVGMSVILAAGLVATAVVEATKASRTTFAALLFVSLLGAQMSISVDLMAIAALWVATVVALAVVSLSQARPSPAGSPSTGPVSSPAAPDARRWLILILLGTPACWLAGSALVSVTGSSSLVGDRPAPVGIVVGLILIGAVVAGVAPFASLRPPPSRRGEVAYVVDGVLPVAGVLLAARAVGMVDPSRPALVGGVLAVVGLVGVAYAGLAARRGSGIAGVGRIDASVALLALLVPSPSAAVGSVLVVGIGALARTFGRWSAAHRPAWLRRPGVPTESPRAAIGPAEWPLPRISRRLVLALYRRIPAFLVWLAESMSERARQAEQRYDLAIGLLIALATVFIYYG